MSVFDDNAQKTPLAQSLHRLGAAKAQDAIQQIGKGLPCTVYSVDGPGIVTVNFEVASTPATLPRTQMPVNKPRYINYPIQPGDIGVALSADLRTGGLTGLGAGTPNLKDTVGNLSAMTFFWLGAKDEEFIDSEALELYGNILCTPDKLAFFGGSKVDKQTITGALSSITNAPTRAVLTSIINALTNYNLVEDGTS